MLKLHIFVLAIVASVSALVIQKNTGDYILEYGYQVQNIQVTTDDKYILTMFYMPPSAQCTEHKNPVFIMHGHYSCSDFTVVVGPKDGLPFILVDDCHPVYLGNARSNIYSQKHEVLSASRSKFWDFSYEEIGYYDIAAMLTYIKTQHPDLAIQYVGHSQGCTELLVLLSRRSEYRSLLGTIVFLAPATYMQHVASPPLKMIATVLACMPIFDLNMNYMQKNVMSKLLFGELCLGGPPTCDILYQLAFGWTNQVNETALQALLLNFPSGNSLKEGRHLMQGYCFYPNDFKQYSHGFFKNMDLYGTVVPPAYDLSGLAHNEIVVYYGDKDSVVVPQDVQQLIKKLPNVKSYLIKEWNHLDFGLALNVREKLNLKLRVLLG